MTEKWVLNASPLILFGRVQQLDLLEKLAPQIIVPDAVIDEIRAGEADDPSAGASIAFAASRRVSNPPIPERIAHWDLGAGESHVIACAIEHSAWAVLDDLAARRCAATHQISVIGSIGIVLRAKRAGLLVSAAPLIEKLKASGMYASDDFLRALLSKIGES